MDKFLVKILLSLSALAGLTASGAEIRVGQTVCEYRVNPLGIDETRPRLTWIGQSDQRGDLQTAYQILVASAPERLAADQGDLWDTGKVAANQSVLVEYDGKPLASRAQCFWKVRVWNKDDKPSAWSEPACWSIGLLKPEDWQAKWIGLEKPNPDDPEAKAPEHRLAARLLRRDFNADAAKEIKRATAYVCGLGVFELRINGAKVGDHVLEPALTDYAKRCNYVTFDVTERIHAGANAVGVHLGNGRFWALRPRKEHNGYGYPRLLLQLEIEYKDGSRTVVSSDENWRASDQGPIRANNEYDGEEYDARMEMARWDQPGFDASGWAAAEPVKAPEGKLTAQMIEPIRVVETLKPVKVSEASPGVYIFDLGQNMVGWCRLKTRGPAGATVKLRHAETLQKDGTLYTANLRTAKATDLYTLKGEGEEVYEPRFTYHGFRYVEVTGYPGGAPALDSLEGCVVHDDLPRAGEFSCSNELLNKIAHNIFWGMRGNYRSIVTDCPQRDERQGWLGDRAAEAEGETYLFNIAPLYNKWLMDIADNQRPDGSISDVVPAYWQNYTNNITWPSLAIIVPGMLYQYYGDKRALERNYPMMKKWMEWAQGTVKDGITSADKYGDWCVPPESPELIHSKDPARQTSKAVLATSYHYINLRLMEKYAIILERDSDAQAFRKSSAEIKTAFNARFFKPEEAKYDNGSQTSYVLPLAFDLTPPEKRQQVFDGLMDKIDHQTQGAIGTGLIGGQWLMRTLSDFGRSDVAYRLATRTEYPSWGYMIGQGATTVWELWNGNTADPAMNSGNHVMLIGDLYIWMNGCLAGLQSSPVEPGFEHIIIQPMPQPGLTFAKASHLSPYGWVRSAWERQEGKVVYRVSVPFNTSAIVFVPAKLLEAVTENGGPAEKAAGVKSVWMEDGRVAVDVGSGDYQFESAQ